MKRVLLVVAAWLAVSPAAYAHVSVAPKEAARGSTETFAFTVPNERDDAATLAVEVFFPENASFSTVNASPVSGWTPQATKTSVAWTGGTISGDNEVTFTVRLGPLPVEGEQLVFKVLQTYEDGEVARWIDVAGARPVELPNPAPIVTLTGEAPTTSEVSATTPTTARRAADDDEDGASNFGVVMLMIATFFAAVGAGIFIGVWRRRAR